MLARARSSLKMARLAWEHDEFNQAASEAYYAMFHAANAALASIGLGFSKHSAVVAAFGREFVKTKVLPAELHRWLGDAFDSRQEATYDYEVELLPQDAQSFIDQAAEFIDTIEGYLQQAQE